MPTSIIQVEERGDVAIVNFQPRDELFVGDSNAMMGAWNTLERMAESKRVIVFRMPRNYLSPKLVDEFWQSASQAPVTHAPARGRAVPAMVAAADASMLRSLKFLHSLPVITVGVYEGEIDFDLLGLYLASKYRICSADTTFVNKTMRRDVAPGSAAAWFLSRFLGFGKARELYLSKDVLSASEACELGIVNQVCEADALTSTTFSLAERFAEFRPRAVEAFVSVVEHLHLDLDGYLNKAGTGFDDLPRSS